MDIFANKGRPTIQGMCVSLWVTDKIYDDKESAKVVVEYNTVPVIEC